MIRHLGRSLAASVALGAGALAWVSRNRHSQEAHTTRTPPRSSAIPGPDSVKLGRRVAADRDVGTIKPAPLPETKQELYELAREREIPGRSKMSKGELEAALGKHP